MSKFLCPAIDDLETRNIWVKYDKQMIGQTLTAILKLVEKEEKCLLSRREGERKMNKRCIYCGEKTNRPKFCCNKHKDRYHNEHNPRGIYAHLKNESGEISWRDIDDNHSYEEECMGVHD